MPWYAVWNYPFGNYHPFVVPLCPLPERWRLVPTGVGIREPGTAEHISWLILPDKPVAYLWLLIMGVSGSSDKAILLYKLSGYLCCQL
jgi:hypothetical protein